MMCGRPRRISARPHEADIGMWEHRRRASATKDEGAMTIRVVVELQAAPGRRDELKRVLEGMIATQGSTARGFLGSTRYEVLDDPDALVEIADWESVEARAAHMQEAAATGAYAPLLELLASPFRATVISQLP